jgi:hypothetical protein
MTITIMVLNLHVGESSERLVPRKMSEKTDGRRSDETRTLLAGEEGSGYAAVRRYDSSLKASDDINAAKWKDLGYHGPSPESVTTLWCVSASCVPVWRLTSLHTHYPTSTGTRSRTGGCTSCSVSGRRKTWNRLTAGPFPSRCGAGGCLTVSEMFGESVRLPLPRSLTLMVEEQRQIPREQDFLGEQLGYNSGRHLHLDDGRRRVSGALLVNAAFSDG